MTTRTPLVSCILPTANRSQYLEQAIRYFQMQDYPNKELVIVFDQAHDLPFNLKEATNVRIVKSINKSIGGKRNLACSHAKGEIIVQWDDDDVYGKNRISKQVGPIIDKETDITALTNTIFVELPSFKTWKCTEEMHRKIFYKDVSGGTLAFRKELWNNMALYPETSLREDADYLKICIEKGAKLQKIDAAGIFVYLRHGNNSWRFTAGTFVTEKGWIQIALPQLIKNNITFYRQIAQTIKNQETQKPRIPYTAMASCIMPTANRPEFIPLAIRNFLSQTYPNKELIILDDGDIKIKHLVPEHPAIRYIKKEEKMTIGAKRNFCCEQAKGDIIIHFDDDDWYSNTWIEKQVTCILTENADICGLANLLFYAPANHQAWHYIYPSENKTWVAGATMAYKKESWKQNPFKNINIGEDNSFVWKTPGKVVVHKHFGDFVSIIHPQNTSPKCTSDKRWMLIPPIAIMKILEKDLLEIHKIHNQPTS